MFSEPDPVTLGVLGSVVLMFVFWFSRRGAVTEIEYVPEELIDVGDEGDLDILELDSEVEEELPEPVVYEEVELVEED